MKPEDQQNDKDRRIRDLERENERLKKQLEHDSREMERLREQRERLQRENQNLKDQLAKIQNSLPQLAATDKTAEAVGVPSSKVFYRRKKEPGDAKKTGGQPGHQGHARSRPVPNTSPVIIECEFCPECGIPLGDPVDGADQSRGITDIPPPTHIDYEVKYHRYWCNHCNRLVRGATPWLPPKQHFGPMLATWITYQRMLGLSIGNIQSSLKETYDIDMSEATILKLESWVASNLKGDYEKLRDEVVRARMVNADETGFRIGGGNGWLWVFAYAMGAFFVLDPSRGRKVPKKVLKGFKGVLGRDGWRPYDEVDCLAQQLDLLHVNRWLEKAEIKHGMEPRRLLSRRGVELKRAGRPPEHFIKFADGVRSILRRAVEFSRRELPPSPQERWEASELFRAEMKAHLDIRWTDRDAARIAKELRRRMDMLFTFVEIGGVPWHNNDAERPIRRGVLGRRNSGGRRTWTGAGVYQILLSIFQTAKMRGENFMALVKEKVGGALLAEVPVYSVASKS
jgi:transposase